MGDFRETNQQKLSVGELLFNQIVGGSGTQPTCHSVNTVGVILTWLAYDCIKLEIGCSKIATSCRQTSLSNHTQRNPRLGVFMSIQVAVIEYLVVAETSS